MTILLFLAIICFLVFVHELGHFAVAKWVGMRVDEFGIGFPPRLFGYKRGETVYSVNALPIGGFVKIYGEDADAQDGELGDESPAPRSFMSKSKWAQSAVLVAGVSMNVLTAFVIFIVVGMVGYTTYVSEDVATENAALRVTKVLDASPAARASLPEGGTLMDVRTESDALSALTPSSFTSFITEHSNVPISITYRMGEEIRVVSVTPEQNVITENPDTYAIGIALGQFEVVQLGFVSAVEDAFTRTVFLLGAITVGIFDLIGEAVLMRADFSDVAGPVGIVGLVGDASSDGMSALLIFTAIISLNLAVINILPFPALDGGRLLMVGIEAVRGAPLPSKFVQYVNFAGFVLLLALMVAVTWNDIVRLI